MALVPHDISSKISSLFSNPEWQRISDLAKESVALSREIDEHLPLIVTSPSVKTNRLLSEANEHALEQSQLLRKANDIASEALALAAAAETVAAAARRAAITANIIATIAIAIAAKDQIIEFVLS